MTELPQGWVIEPLMKHLSSRSGDSKIIKGKQSSKPLPGLVQGFSASGADVWVTEAQHKGQGIVVSAVGARCGKTFRADGDWTAIANTHVLVPSKDCGLDFKWLWYLTNDESFWIRSGTAQPFVKVKDTLLRPQLIPPIEEQERIVEALDLYIQNLDTATSELLSDLQRLEDLERSARFSEFERANSIESSNMVQIKDVTEKARSIDPKTLGVDTFKYVDISSISTDLESPQILEVTETSKAPSRARQQIMEGDTVFSTVRPYQKKIALIKEELSGQIASTGFCVLRPLSHLVDARYLYHYLKSDMLLDQVLPLQRGASYPAVGDADVKQSTMPLPDLATQQTIVRNLDEIVGTVKALKNQLERTIEKAQVLRRALLHKAFSGQLNKGN